MNDTESVRQYETITANKSDTEELKMLTNSYNDKIAVAIRDYGIGFPEAELKNIFTRFYRVDKVRTRKIGGSGLGLSIAQELAENNNMNISVGSKINEGTIFKLTMDKEGGDGEAQ